MHFQYHKYRTAGIKIIFWKKRIIEIYDLNDKLITGVSNQDQLDEFMDDNEFEYPEVIIKENGKWNSSGDFIIINFNYNSLTKEQIHFYKCIFVKNHGYFTECKILSSFTVYNPTQKNGIKGFFSCRFIHDFYQFLAFDY